MPDPDRDASSGQFARRPAVAPPPDGELAATRTGDQSAGYGGGNPFLAFGGTEYGYGESPANPCGFPGWGSDWIRHGTYQTYRLMLTHPVVRFVRSIATAPLYTNVWSIEPTREDLPARAEAWKRHLEAVLLPQRKQLVRIGLRAADYGAGFGEKVWAVRDGLYHAAVKWLANDRTEIVADKGGNFLGLSQPGVDGGWTAGYDVAGNRVPGLGPYKAFRIVHADSPEAGGYGEGRLEWCRPYAWVPWLRTMGSLAKLDDKLAGTVGILFGPAGTFTDATTGEVTKFMEMGEKAIRAIKAHQFGYMPTIALAAQDSSGKVDIDKFVALSKASAFELKVIDFGNLSPAIAGMMQKLVHFEGLMFNGYLRSTRTGMESEHGSRADADTHTDSGIEDAEGLDDDIADQVSAGLADDILVLNYGEGARGSFRVKAAAILDARMRQIREFMRLLMANPAVAFHMARRADLRQILTELDIPQDPEFDEALGPEAAGDDGDEPAGKPVNGNGRGRLAGAGANGND